MRDCCRLRVLFPSRQTAASGSWIETCPASGWSLARWQTHGWCLRLSRWKCRLSQNPCRCLWSMCPLALQFASRSSWPLCWRSCRCSLEMRARERQALHGEWHLSSMSTMLISFKHIASVFKGIVQHCRKYVYLFSCQKLDRKINTTPISACSLPGRRRYLNFWNLVVTVTFQWRLQEVTANK